MRQNVDGAKHEREGRSNHCWRSSPPSSQVSISPWMLTIHQGILLLRKNVHWIFSLFRTFVPRDTETVEVGDSQAPGRRSREKPRLVKHQELPTRSSCKFFDAQITSCFTGVKGQPVTNIQRQWMRSIDQRKGKVFLKGKYLGTLKEPLNIQVNIHIHIYNQYEN